MDHKSCVRVFWVVITVACRLIVNSRIRNANIANTDEYNIKMCLWFHSLHLAATTTETRKKLQINWYWQPKKEARMWSIFDRVRNGDRNIFAHGISSQLQFEAFFRQDMRYRKFHFLDRHFVSGVPLCLCLYCIYWLYMTAHYPQSAQHSYHFVIRLRCHSTKIDFHRIAFLSHNRPLQPPIIEIYGYTQYIEWYCARTQYKPDQRNNKCEENYW